MNATIRFLTVVAAVAVLVSCHEFDKISVDQLNIKVSSRTERALVRWAWLSPYRSDSVRIDIAPPREESQNFMESIRWEGRIPGNFNGYVILRLNKDGDVVGITGTIDETSGKYVQLAPEPGWAAIRHPNQKLTVRILQKLYELGVL